MPRYNFVVARRLRPDQAQLTGERYGIDSGTLMEMIETYHAAVGEEDPSFHWLEDGPDLRTFEDTVDAEACTKPEMCLKTLKAFREGIEAHAGILPPFTWVVERRPDGTAGLRSSGARVRFDGLEWSVSGGWEPTVAREVGKGRKGRTIDLRTAATWECESLAGGRVVLEFDRHPFGAFVKPDLDGIAEICERARKLRGLVAIACIP